MNIERTTDYIAWIGNLKARYRTIQIKVAVAVNSALIEFYWNLGRDISEKYGNFTKSEIYGSQFFDQLSQDLKLAMPESKGFSPVNLRYCLRFYELYIHLLPPVGDKSQSGNIFQQVVEKSSGAYMQQVVEQLIRVPWGHHCVIIDKCKGDAVKALFYATRTVSQGWSRSVLLNMIGTDLYKREGRAQTNFTRTMIPADSDLACQITKDPYIFEIQGLSEPYREKELKAAICANIEHLLLQMGKGVSFLGREYRLEVGKDELFVDMLFYVIPLRRYLVMEVKTDSFKAADFGQLQGYVSVVNRQLNLPDDKPAIGLLVCREHNRVLAQYLIDDARTPLAISDYELLRILPEKIKSELPTIAEMEAQLAESMQ